MSTHIEMDEDNFSQITTYHGTLDEKYSFIVDVSYRTNRIGYNIDSVEFIGHKDNKSDFYWNKAENKIREFVTKWLFDKPKNKGELKDE